MLICSHCGIGVSEGVSYCPECGERLKRGFTPEEKQKYIHELESFIEEEKKAKDQQKEVGDERAARKQVRLKLVWAVLGALAIAVGMVVGVPARHEPIEPAVLPMDEAIYRSYVEGIMQEQLELIENLNLAETIESPEFPNVLAQMGDLYGHVSTLNPPPDLRDFHASYEAASAKMVMGAMALCKAWDNWKQGTRGEAIDELRQASDTLIHAYSSVLLLRLRLQYPEQMEWLDTSEDAYP